MPFTGEPLILCPRVKICIESESGTQPRGTRALIKMKKTKRDPELIDAYKCTVFLLLISFTVTTH